LFLAVTCWLIAFVGDLPVPKTLDSGSPEPRWQAVVTNLGLLALFGVQHSGMAREGFKRWWTRWVPVAIERSTYVVAASLVLGLVLWQWRPLLTEVWRLEGVAGAVLQVGFWGGWGLVFASTFVINHLNLVGIEQAWYAFRGRTPPQAVFKTPPLYRMVRHPLYLGLVVGVWATPHMTEGHLLFAAGCTTYILLGIAFEERDLVRHFGDVYRTYQSAVPMLLPFSRRRQR
jgi:protein-S-isoprenylcysteine O-methyltransferase Ste14